MEDELDIKNLVNTLWRKKKIILIVTIIFFVFGLFKYGRASKVVPNNSNIGNNSFNFGKYTAEASFIVGNEEKVNESSGSALLNSGETVPTDSTSMSKNRVVVDGALVATYTDILKSKKILNGVIEELKLDISATELSKSILLTRAESSNLLKLYVGYSDGRLALEITDKLLNKLIETSKEIYKIDGIILDKSSILEEEEIEKLKGNLNTNQTATNGTSAPVVQPKEGGISIKKVIIVTAFGFILSCGVIVVIELFDSTIKNQEELEKATKLKTLTTIKNDENDVKNKFRILRVNINECKTILITSAEKESGKSYVATNLAKSFARLGKRVLLLDLTKNESSLLKKYEGVGLSDFLESQEKFIEKFAIETKNKNLSVLPVGKKVDGITEFLESPRMAEILKDAERIYDVIIIDTENVLESANTLAMAKIAKFSVLVCLERKTQLSNVIKAKNNIEDVGGNVIGTVLNKMLK
ncbi:MAG: AAA family ATPase [Clostridia bacterium]|nr:AAA family ATPase [Clostridia bacterium]